MSLANGNQSSAFANVTQYASNLQYRAWGAMKHLTFGTGRGKNLDNQFNSRLQISRFEVNDTIGSNYQYYPDGRIKFVDDISMETPVRDKFDRSYVYDHVGRLIEAKSGTEAHTPSVTTDDRPYREAFGFDEWNNLTARTGRVWAGDMLPASTTYTDNHRQGWTYDADGRPTIQTNLTSEYDASGRKIKTVDTTPRGHFFTQGPTVKQGFDGDGHRLKQDENTTATTFLIRSTVLGEVVWEIGYVNGTWQKKTGFVYGGGRMLAIQTIGVLANLPTVIWRYQNPVTGSQRGVEPTELDPLGLNAGVEAPDQGVGGSEAPDLVFPRYGDIMNGSTGCTINWQMVSCDTVTDGMEVGFLEPQGPRNEEAPNQWEEPVGDPLVLPGDMRMEPRGGELASAGSSEETDKLPIDPTTGLPIRGSVQISASYLQLTTTRDNRLLSLSFTLRAKNTDSKDKGHLDDCNRFANSVRDITYAATSVDNFLDELSRQFLGAADSSGFETFKAAAGGNIPQKFSSEGMKPQFIGEGNQPRHFIGAFMAITFSGLSYIYLQNRGDGRGGPEHPWDLALNEVAAIFASRFIHQPTSPDLGSIRSQFSVTLRRELCQHPSQ